MLARKHGATIGCPITTGIFAWIAAHAVAEEAADGEEQITPYWRTLKAQSEVNPRYPGGVDEQRERLVPVHSGGAGAGQEGHAMLARSAHSGFVDRVGS